MVDRSLIGERVLPVAILALAVVSVPVMVFSEDGLARLETLRAEKARADEEASKLAERIHRLRSDVQRVKNDPSAVERVARDQLGLVRRTEIVYQFGR